MHDRDLTSYYDTEARAGLRTRQGELRHRLRAEFAEVLAAERRSRLVDVGAGPGLDTRDWARRGFEVVGLDLAPANAAIMGSLGLSAVTGSLYHLPFATGTFDCLWTMSTFVHVPHERFDEAITEMLRVVRPGAALGIGTWGGRDFEGHVEIGEIRPARFFSLAAHRRWRSMLAQHGEVERFDTFEPDPGDGWEYQFAVLRATG